MMQVDYKAFGRRLREYRHARNLTLEKLSELVGVSFQHIGMLERGKRSPSMEMLISLCYALDCTCDALFQDSLPEQDVCVFRQPHPILRNTLSNWVLANQPDESLLPNDAISISFLRSIFPPLTRIFLPLYPD